LIYTIYIITLSVCFICSLISFRLHYPFHLRLFAVFLGISLVTEIAANLVMHALHLKSNYSIYSAFMLIEYCIYAVYFRSIIHNKKTRRFLNAFLVAFPVVWTATTFFVFGRHHWNSYVILLGDAFTTAMCVVYFREVFISDELIDFKSSPEFWIVAGLIIYSCCEIPITGMLNYLATNYVPEALLLENALQLLNIFLCIIIIYAYLCPLLTNTTKYS